MTIEDALYTYLKDYAGIKALVGRRIYPMTIPQRETMPALSYQMISNPQIHTTGSDSCNPQNARFQINCWAAKYYEMKALAVQVKAALKDYADTMGGAGGVVVQRVFFENESDIYDETMERNAVALDFIFWYLE